MTYPIFVIYEARHRTYTTTEWAKAGTKEQMNLVHYHEKLKIPLREIEFIDMNTPRKEATK